MIDFIKNNLDYEQKRSLKKLIYIFENISNGVYDIYKYLKYSNSIKNYKKKNNLEAQLYKECHRIEKGMSLPNLRMGFGEQAIERIYANLKNLLLVTKDSSAIDYAGSVMREYIKLHQAYNLKEPIKVMIDEIINITDDSNFNAGTIELKKEDLIIAAGKSFNYLANSRHSIRQYSSEPISEELLKSSTLIASRTPSVCNRQAYKVRFYTDKAKVDQLLMYQNGNKSFREEIPVVAVISVDLKYFEGAGERNQAYIDGGLFAMSLVYALHSNALGTCFLNWSVKHDIDRKFRKVSLIPDNEVIITLLSVGNLKDEFKVATSPRKRFCDLYELIET